MIPTSVSTVLPDVGVRKLVRALTRSIKQQSGGVDPSSSRPGSDLSVAELSDAGKRKMMLKAHNSLEGHHGINCALNILNSVGVRWPKMAKDVTTFISECIVCQKEMARMQSTGESRSSLAKICNLRGDFDRFYRSFARRCAR